MITALPLLTKPPPALRRRYSTVTVEEGDDTNHGHHPSVSDIEPPFPKLHIQLPFFLIMNSWEVDSIVHLFKNRPKLLFSLTAVFYLSLFLCSIWLENNLYKVTSGSWLWFAKGCNIVSLAILHNVIEVEHPGRLPFNLFTGKGIEGVGIFEDLSSEQLSKGKPYTLPPSTDYIRIAEDFVKSHEGQKLHTQILRTLRLDMCPKSRVLMPEHPTGETLWSPSRAFYLLRVPLFYLLTFYAVLQCLVPDTSGASEAIVTGVIPLFGAAVSTVLFGGVWCEDFVTHESYLARNLPAWFLFCGAFYWNRLHGIFCMKEFVVSSPRQFDCYSCVFSVAFIYFTSVFLAAVNAQTVWEMRDYTESWSERERNDHKKLWEVGRRKPRMVANVAMNSLIFLMSISTIYGVIRRSPVVLVMAAFVCQCVCEGAQHRKDTIKHIKEFDISSHGGTMRPNKVMRLNFLREQIRKKDAKSLETVKAIGFVGVFRSDEVEIISNLGFGACFTGGIIIYGLTIFEYWS